MASSGKHNPQAFHKVLNRINTGNLEFVRNLTELCKQIE